MVQPPDELWIDASLSVACKDASSKIFRPEGRLHESTLVILLSAGPRAPKLYSFQIIRSEA